MGKRQRSEIIFKQQAEQAGFLVKQPKSIRISKPVLDKCGKLKKIVTSPDFTVVNPRTDEEFLVEITNSGGNTAHKAAQKRVV